MTAPATPLTQTELKGPKAKAFIECDHRVVSQHYRRDYPLVVEDAAGLVVTEPADSAVEILDDALDTL